MAIIYLRHHRHGAKVAIAEAEAAADEKNGWERYDIAAPAEPSLEVEPTSNPLHLKRPYKRKTA